MKKAGCHLMVFVKAPIPGKVKTRLIPILGGKAASVLYQKMALHCLAVAIEANVGPVDLWCAPSCDHPFFIDCARRFRVNLHRQIEGDLGERMARAFSETLRISNYAILMGSDCPCLTGGDIREVKATLERGWDAAIIPAEDGGYVLIGLRHNAPELFSEISWGTEFVLEQTRARLRQLGWKWRELSERWDVDRPGDLQRLALGCDIDSVWPFTGTDPMNEGKSDNKGREAFQNED